MRLTTRDLGFRYGAGPWLFRGVDLDLRPGPVTALTGPSGTGKSTLLAVLGGTLGTVEGQVEREGITTIARIAQTAHGVPHRSVRDHITLPMLATGSTRDDADERAHPIAALFGIEALLDAPYAQLSGGEAQRLMLARAVAQRADLILADEPTASLDAQNAHSVIEVIGRLGSSGAIVVVATHDPRARDACDAVVDLGQFAA